ncbi:type VI secretion system TssO [Saccharicrinis fermentans]|uniref:Four helix bundle sensory module for signal transduction n=1 Tax=Saccharicrinis fermentans DSM 9555 = JCM 21142 TaxID=869213 RepID=W7YCP6_9BACT|nr:type VI secretion system TssO [Saccharicrinis fermentans]GAF05243.1 hypothetical protein JCM21142_93970 [Saccharicrinis fermentans DSM 9555 = JCM 21142]
MKPKNNAQIRFAYALFALSLVSAALVGVLSVFFFIRTAQAELALIGSKTQEYDRINACQIEMIGRIDTLYNYMQMLNSSEKINDVLLQKTISNKKMTLLNALNQIPEDDSYLFRKLTKQVNTFLNVNDSIRLLAIEERLAKEELTRCIEDNKQLVRKLSIGGIQINK